jgi:peroxiredoxin
MALTPSNMLDLGIKAQDFSLINVIDGNRVTYQNIKGETGTLVMFICVHCPYVMHVEPELSILSGQYKEKGIGIVAISSNDIDKYPQDSPECMKRQAIKNKFDFPYLFDEDQSVARAYDAACTPDFYLFNKEDKLVYRGRLDESRPGNDLPLTGADLRSAIDAILIGAVPDQAQYPSMGCNIKWK